MSGLSIVPCESSTTPNSHSEHSANRTFSVTVVNFVGLIYVTIIGFVTVVSISIRKNVSDAMLSEFLVCQL